MKVNVMSWALLVLAAGSACRATSSHSAGEGGTGGGGSGGANGSVGGTSGTGGEQTVGGSAGSPDGTGGGQSGDGGMGGGGNSTGGNSTGGNSTGGNSTGGSGGSMGGSSTGGSGGSTGGSSTGGTGGSSSNEPWTLLFGTDQSDTALSVAVDEADNIYVVGSTQGTLVTRGSGNDPDAYIAKFDTRGSLVWADQFGRNTDEAATSVVVDAQGDVIVVGETNGTLGQLDADTPGGGGDVFVRKYTLGTTEVAWTRTFGSNQLDGSGSVAVLPSGDVAIVGRTMGDLAANLGGSQDGFLRVYSPQGVLTSTLQFGSDDEDLVFEVEGSDNDTLYVSGATLGELPNATRVAGSGQDAFLLRFKRGTDNTWSVDWVEQFGTSAADWANALAVASGALYVGGRTTGTFPSTSSAGSADAFLRRYDITGANPAPDWTVQFGSDSYDYAYGLEVAADGTLVISGFVSEGQLPGQSAEGMRDGYVRQYDAGGYDLWTQQFGTTGNDSLIDVAVDSAGHVLVVGGTDGALDGQARLGTTDTDAFLKKLVP